MPELRKIHKILKNAKKYKIPAILSEKIIQKLKKKEREREN